MISIIYLHQQRQIHAIAETAYLNETSGGGVSEMGVARHSFWGNFSTLLR